MLDAIGKHYRTESIHRNYRLLIRNNEIQEPTSVELRKEETEQIMHDIPKWAPKGFVNFLERQTALFEERKEDGFE